MKREDMKVEQLEKNLDVILANLDEELFFVCLIDVKCGKNGKTYKRIYSAGVKQMSIEKIGGYIEDDNYILVKIS